MRRNPGRIITALEFGKTKLMVSLDYVESHLRPAKTTAEADVASIKTDAVDVRTAVERRSDMAEGREKFRFLRSEPFIRIGDETFECDLTDTADPQAEVLRHPFGTIYFKNKRPTKDKLS